LYNLLAGVMMDERKVLSVETKKIEFDPRSKVCARLEPILKIERI